MIRKLVIFLLSSPFLASVAAQEPSVCYGSTDDGYLKNGWKLPLSGANYAAYSIVGSMIGRTYIHSEVYKVVLDAYRELNSTMPGKTFVYGETGEKNGGEFSPHKTHRNGLSIDFMVPILNRSGESVSMPTNAFNRWGYDLEFDSSGRLGDQAIDVEAMAEHIYQLHQVAERHGIGIWRIIFDPQLQLLLHKTSRWSYLRDNIKFSERRSWVRHDEHYHVDFIVECQAAEPSR